MTIGNKSNMKLNLFCWVWVGISCIPSIALTQDTLSLESAVQIALENNYGIQVARMNYQIDDNNVDPGNAGLLPTVSVNGSAGFDAFQVARSTFAGDFIAEVDTNGTANNQAVSLGLTYTLFDGFNNVNNYRILKATRFSSEAQAVDIISNTLASVISSYYEVARLENAYQIQEQTLQISKDRLQRIDNQLEFGSTSRLAALNAEVDLNTDSANLATSKFNVENAKRNLSFLLGVEITDQVRVSRMAEFNDALLLENIKDKVLASNPTLKASEKNLQIARLNENVVGSAWFPRLDLNSSYGYTRITGAPGSILETQENIGFTGGLSLTYDIFNGNRRKINRQNAEIQTSVAEKQLEEIQASLERDLTNAYNTYLNSLQIYNLEQTSLEAAQVNFDRTNESLKLGQATQIEFRDAQLNLLRVQNRLNNLRYDIKLAEIELLRLSGSLVENSAVTTP